MTPVACPSRAVPPARSERGRPAYSAFTAASAVALPAPRAGRRDRPGRAHGRRRTQRSDQGTRAAALRPGDACNKEAVPSLPR